jgi:GxxExxY protein
MTNWISSSLLDRSLCNYAAGSRRERGLLGDLGVFARDCFGLDVTENEVAKPIVDAAYRVHTSLGAGLLESAYEAVLAYELEKRGLRTVRQQTVPILYQGTRIEMGFRADLSVEDSVIVEIKSVEAVAPVHSSRRQDAGVLADPASSLKPATSSV